jgi:hypothetical protein
LRWQKRHLRIPAEAEQDSWAKVVMNSLRFDSILAEPLANFVQYKQALNRKYRPEAAVLPPFDRYLSGNHVAGWDIGPRGSCVTGSGTQWTKRQLLKCRGLSRSMKPASVERLGDPTIICDCGLKNRILLTGDQDLVYTYAPEISKAGIAVYVTTNNNEGPDQWGPRIIAAKGDIWRELKRRKKPFTARISSDGRITQVRLYVGRRWNTISIGAKNPPHENKQKAEAIIGSAVG